MLSEAANSKQKEEWLNPLLTGDIRSAFAMTEPDVASSDARNISLRIIKVDQGYLLNGRKWYISGAGHQDCELLIVIGALEGAGSRRHCCLLVPAKADGVTVVRKQGFMGWEDHCAPIAELTFENVLVNKSALVGAEGEGFSVAQCRLGPARIQHAMRAIGLGETLIELMVARSAGRAAFGRQISEFDTVQGWIAQSRVKLEQSRLLVQKAAWKLDREDHSSVWKDVSYAKIAVAQSVHWIADHALQCFGAAGGSEDWPIHGALAWARAFRVFDGPDEVHLRQIYKAESKSENPDVLFEYGLA
ncbi:acyl-CoA dehydrogenase family protein [Ruegeria sp. 2012CJ15-1]